MTQNNLAPPTGSASVASGRITRAGHLPYQQALEVYTREAFPEDWAVPRTTWANAYGDRIRGERAENIEQAIDHHTSRRWKSTRGRPSRRIGP